MKTHTKMLLTTLGLGTALSLSAQGGLVLNYTYEGDTGNTATNSGSSGVTNNMLTQTTSAFTDVGGARGRVLDNKDQTTFANPVNIAGSDFTIATWYKGTDADGGYFYDEDSTGRRIVTSGVNNGNKAGFYDGSFSASSVDTSAFSDDEWHHLAYVFDNTAGTYTVYLDGVAAAPVSDGGFGNLFKGGINQAFFGERPTVDRLNAVWFGLFDDTAVWDEALTSQQISNAIANGATGYNIPEPGSLALLGLGGLLIARRRRK